MSVRSPGLPSSAAPRADGRRRRGVRIVSPAWLDGSRAVWWPAAVAGLILAAVILWQATIPRNFYTGTNSVGVRSLVASVKPGETLCVPKLRLPAGTGRVQLAVFANRPRFTARVRVSTPGDTIRSTMAGLVGPTTLVFARAPIPVRPSSPATVPATVCISPVDGPIGLGGMVGLQANQVPAVQNGVPLENRVGVWFLPPAGEQRTLLASAGQIFSRAALFRPGIVGPWTYPVLLFVMLPLLWICSLVLLARAAAGRQLILRGRVVRGGLAVALIAFLNAGSWALITPAFNAPDEPDHFADVQYLATTGNAPARVPSSQPPFSTDETLAMNAVNVYSQVSLPEARPPWLRGEEVAWEHETSTMPPADNGGGYTPAASPHQPAYYLLVAPAYELARSQSTFSQLTAVRLASALLGALVAFCAFGVVREMLPRWPVAALAAGLLVAFQPMFGFISGAVNNDNGVNAAAALSLYLVIRGLRRGLTWRLALALGATVALVPAMKETGYEIYPAVALGVAGMIWRAHRREDARAWAALAGAFIAVREGWLLLQPALYPSVAGHSTGAGGIQATGALSLAEHRPGRFLEYLWELFLPKLGFMGPLFPRGQWPFEAVYVVRGWGAFGWYVWIFPNWVYGVIIAALVVVGLLALSTAIRERVALLVRSFEVAVIALFPICTLVAVEAAFFAPEGGRTVVAEQGRYIFPAIAALSAIAVAGTFGLGRRLHASIATVLVVAMFGLSYASQLLTLGSFFS